jgi:iron complex outermembrane receptor protein
MLASGGLAFLAMGHPALAQEGASASGAQIGEVVVTATKTGATALQKTPIALAAVSAADVDKSLLSTVKDLVQLTPNIQVAQNNVFAQIFIRGVGSNNLFNGSDPSTTVQMDGVYLARPFGQFASFLDVERVEVLRGPQGTLYGRNSVGGTINIISRAPTDEFHAKGELVGGDYATFQEQAYVSGAVIPEKMQFSVSEMYMRHDPYRENVSTGNNIDDQNVGGMRAQLRIEPTDYIDATTRVDFTSAQYHPSGYSKILQPYDALTNSILGDYGKVALSQPDTGVIRTEGVAEDITVSLPDDMKLRSVTAYRRDTTKTFTDTDSTDKNTTYSLTSEAQRQFSEELNLSGDIAKRFTYVTGFYFFHELDDTYSVVNSEAAGTYTGIFPKSHDTAYAGYAQGSYHITDKLTATVGLRYTTEEKIFEQNYGVYSAATGVAKTRKLYLGDGRYHALTPKFEADYQFTPRIYGYASVTEGFKSGGFNQSSITAVAQKGFAPEKIWSYEAGLKTEWLDRRMRLNFTGFHYDYSNMQVSNFITPGVTDISNAATSTVNGFEFESQAKPSRDLTLGLNVSWLDATYDKYANASGQGGAVIDASGNHLNNSPEWSGNVFSEYDWRMSHGDYVSLRGEYFYQEREYFTAANLLAQSQGAYGLLNGYLGYNFPDGHTTISLYGKNILDKQYVTVTATISPVVSGHPGDPRTFGVQLLWKM